MIDPAIGPARRRIRRIRWTTTVVFAALTALCLTVLVVIALRVDSSARRAAFDDGLRQQAGALSELVGADNDGQLDLSRLDATEVERTTPVLGIVTRGAIVYAEPDQDALPSDSTLATWLDQQQASPAVTSPTPTASPGGTGDTHWATAPILDTTAIGSGRSIGAIVVVGGPVPGAAAHHDLAVRLSTTAALLVVLAAALGHLVSGFATRPAVRGLADQERFLVDAAHELRTPLSVLRLVVDDATARPDDTDAQRTAVRRAQSQVGRLTQLVDGLMLRARTAVGTVDVALEPLRLDQLVERAVDELTDAADVVVDAPPTVVSANEEILAQGVRNLVENALVHGAPPVRVTVRPSEVVVTDAGPGVPADARRSVVRAGATTGSGTGTGLSIAAWAARVHGGDLRLDDADGGGLRARLVLHSARRPRRR